MNEFLEVLRVPDVRIGSGINTEKTKPFRLGMSDSAEAALGKCLTVLFYSFKGIRKYINSQRRAELVKLGYLHSTTIQKKYSIAS